LLLALLLVGLVLSQKVPAVSEVFYSAGIATLTLPNMRPVTGPLRWSSDQPTGRALERYDYDNGSEHNTFYLQRYDLGKLYTIELKEPCQISNVTGRLPAYWSWLDIASYKGRSTYRGRATDIWEATLGYATNGIAVYTDRPDVPVQFWRKSPQGDVSIDFDTFVPDRPPETVFDVPKECRAALLKCVARATMLARAEVWVANHVPYNQGATYNGYREDCSGYVSDIWGLAKPGYTTFTLPEVSHQITKAELQPGDVLLDVQEHVVLFGGWANSEQSQYTAYEETQPGEGTVKRTTPYPYWYNTAAFKPYRYNGVC